MSSRGNGMLTRPVLVPELCHFSKYNSREVSTMSTGTSIQLNYTKASTCITQHFEQSFSHLVPYFLIPFCQITGMSKILKCSRESFSCLCFYQNLKNIFQLVVKFKDRADADHIFFVPQDVQFILSQISHILCYIWLR